MMPMILGAGALIVIVLGVLLAAFSKPPKNGDVA